MRFNIGDVVRIGKKSVHYGGSEHNPADMDGEFYQYLPEEPGYIYRVRWENGNTNSYREEDLRLRRRKDA